MTITNPNIYAKPSEVHVTAIEVNPIPVVTAELVPEDHQALYGYQGPSNGNNGPPHGAPGPQYGAPGPQYGAPGPQQGFPPQQGYPGNQQGYPGNQQGYAPQQGYPGAQYGAPVPQPQYGNQGYNNQGMQQGGNIGTCRSCGQQFQRAPNSHPSNAQYYRCDRCSNPSFQDFCVVS